MYKLAEIGWWVALVATPQVSETYCVREYGGVGDAARFSEIYYNSTARCNNKASKTKRGSPAALWIRGTFLFFTLL